LHNRPAAIRVELYKCLTVMLQSDHRGDVRIALTAVLKCLPKLHRFREDDKCECGASETVVHVLIDCPKLAALRRKLRRQIGTAFNDISGMLGGGSQGKEGKKDDMQDSSILGAVLDFAEASQRFQSRAPQGR
jgi:hypothetical protein